MVEPWGRAVFCVGLSGNFVGEVASGNRKIFKTVIQGRVFQKEEHKNHVKLGKPTSVCKRHQIV